MKLDRQSVLKLSNWSKCQIDRYVWHLEVDYVIPLFVCFYIQYIPYAITHHLGKFTRILVNYLHAVLSTTYHWLDHAYLAIWFQIKLRQVQFDLTR